LVVLVLGSGGGCTKSARAHRALKAANRDFEEENYDDAEVEYKNVRRLEPMNPTAIGQLGRLYAKEGRIIDARIYLTQATKMEPNSLPFQLALGQLEATFHDATNAAKIALRILSAQPTNEEALFLLMDSFGPPQALRQVLDNMPHATENPAYHLALGMIALRQKKLADAESEFNLAVAANPKSSRAYFALAEIHALKKDVKGAAQALKTAADLAPLRSPIRSRYIDFLLQSGNVEEARKMLQETSEKAPDYIPGWVSLMNLALAERKYDEVGKLAETILARDDKNYDGLLGRGSVSLAKSDAATALAQFQHMDSLYKKSPQVKYDLAAAYLMAHDKTKGMASLNQALVLDPGYPQAALLLAQLDIRSGDSAAAVALLTQFIKKAPGVGQAHLLLADAYLAQRQPDNALAVYRNLAETLPKSPQIPLLMGVVLAEQHKFAEARVAFEKSMGLTTNNIGAVEQLINLDIAEHKYKDATALAQAQIDKTPKAAEPWELQAKIDLGQTNLDRAEKDLLKAIDLNPDLPAPYLLLAQVYAGSHKNQEALQKLNALVERTNSAPAYLQIAAIHEQFKEYEPASVAYEKVLSIDSNSVTALNNLAYIYSERLSKPDKAYELAQRARELLPDNPSIGDTLGWILYKKGDYSHALTILQDCVEKSPTDAEIQYHLGMTHYMLGEEDPARVALQRAVALQGDFPTRGDAINRLAVLNMDTTTASASGLAELEKALQDHPDDPVILNRMGMLQEREGAWEKAAATYKTALKQHPDDVRIMTELARLYALRLNQPDEALPLATAAHKLAPDNADATGVLGHLVYHNSRTGADYALALSLLESASDQLPKQPELLDDLAWAYYSVGRIADAETTMQKALQTGVKFPGSEDAKRFVALADALSSASAAQAAAGQAQQILQTDAKYVPALMVSGVAQERAGNFTAAQDAYNKALEVFPLFVPAARQLAILDARHFPDDAQGYALAEKARTAYPDDLEVARSLGILSYYQAQYRRSSELLRESIGKGMEDGEVYYCLGMDDYQLKQNKDSKQALQRALTLKLPDKLAAEAKRILAGLK
jgi:tetratricopeptide (TPR) repeat protein